MTPSTNAPELRIRVGDDGRIECRNRDGQDAPSLSFDPAFFGTPDSDSAQRALGRFVFSLLQGLSPSNTIETPNPADTDGESPDAQYEQFVALQTRAMKDYSASMLEMAEKSLYRSAEAGFAPAVAALKDWPSIRSVAEMLIARGPEQPR